MNVIKPLVAGLVLLAGGYLLERGGVFLYTGYVLVRIAAALAALGFLVWALLHPGRREASRWLVAVIIGCVLVLLAWRLESYATSPRKVFYLTALKVKEGMLFSDVEKQMAPYRLFSVEPGHASFAFRGSAQTEDVLVVRYDVKTTKILEAHLSLD
jgi:hypothetical protein